MNRNLLVEILMLILLVVVRFAVQYRRIPIAATQHNPRVYKVREPESSRHPPRMRFIPCISLITALLLSFSVQAVPLYSVTDLGSNTVANDINDSGQIVGRFQATNGNWHAFLFSGGVLIDLGTLGGNSSGAESINNSGQIVGSSRVANGSLHAFRYSNGVMNDLGTLTGGSESSGNGINNSGQIVGQSRIADGITFDGFLYNGATMKDLGNFYPVDINDSGQMAGYSSNNHASLNSAGIISDLGTLGGEYSNASSINSSGQIVGASSRVAKGDYHGFLYSSGVLSDLGSLGGDSYAYVINNSGQIVGSSLLDNGNSHAYIYSSGVMNDLNDLLYYKNSGWEISSANSINNSGLIVADASNDGGKTTHAVLLTPVTTNPNLSLKGSSLTIQLNAGQNLSYNADWWVVALSPWGHWYSYVYPNRWNDIGTDLSQVSPAYQGPLSNISSLALFDATGIPAGNYVFYFGVDMNMNGILDYNQLFYSSLPLTFIDARYSGIYSGTFTGGDTGTFNATVSANGAITGTVYSNTDKLSYSAIGQVLSNGSMTMAVDFGAASSGAAFVGNINLTNGNASGTWTNSYWGISGSFSGAKN